MSVAVVVVRVEVDVDFDVVVESVVEMGVAEVVDVVFVGVGLVVRMSSFISRTMTIFHKEFSKRSSWQVGSERHEVEVAKLGT